MSTGVHLFGIRHHGPGSARSLVSALQKLAPQIVLIEGPPDANDLLALASRPGLTPPVALLVYAQDVQNKAILYPFASYSPEWCAIQYALGRAIPVRFIDLPQTHRLGEGEESRQSTGDPLLPMAIAAGHGDAERWWDFLVESRNGDDVEVFTAIHEMMSEVRAQLDSPESLTERRREAWMRKCIRAARSEGFERIAVVCGAYHTPALANLPTAKQDDELLRGLPKVKTGCAWVPWSYERLAASSGYGAGVESPMWYELLWARRPSLGAEWITRAAQLLRAEDVPISSAHVIETCRLAEALAAVRERPVPGLGEYNDAAVSVLGSGNIVNLNLIRRRWHFGEKLGVVPEDFPATPLQQDLASLQKRLRLKPAAAEKTYDLDLRQLMDRERSHLLRRLRVLGIEWGKPAPHASMGKGTFHEVWQVLWEPEFAVRLVEASRYGHTIEQAAVGVLAEKSASAAKLADLVHLLDDALFSDLENAIQPLVGAIERSAAAQSDVLELIDAVPPLVSVYRYGNVRETDTSLVSEILETLVPRVFIGLVPAAANIDADAAQELWKRMAAAQHALASLSNAEYLQGWYECLARLLASEATHPLISGYACRLRYDAQQMDFDALANVLSLALSGGNPPDASASWIEGLLSGGGMLLIHDDRLRTVLDRWLREQNAAQFTQVLPLLRRAFAQFPAGERRVLGQKLKLAGTPESVAVPTRADDFDEPAARAAIALLGSIWSQDS